MDFTRTHQRRPDDPDVIYRIDEAESHRDGRILDEPGEDTMDVDDENVEDDTVIINNSYDSSVAVDTMLSGFEPSVDPLMQGREGKGLTRLANLSDIEHVVVVGPFSSGTNAICEYLEKYFDVTVHPPRRPPAGSVICQCQTTPEREITGRWAGNTSLLSARRMRLRCSQPTRSSFK